MSRRDLMIVKKNRRVRVGPAVIGAVLLAAVLAGAAGCGGGGAAPPAGGTDAAGRTDASSTPAPTGPTEARARLAALAAAAKDRRMVAFYTLRTRNRPDRTVVATLATDGTWRVDVPGGAHAGAVDVAIAGTRDGLYQCVLPTTSRPGSCVRVAAPDGALPAAIDPRVPHVFTDWREVLTDRRAALSVAPAAAPQGVTGACYSVESTSASLAAPVDPGIYCYAPDGTLTGANTGFGTLVLASPPGAAPPTVALPATVVVGQPLRTAAPPTQSP